MPTPRLTDAQQKVVAIIFYVMTGSRPEQGGETNEQKILFYMFCFVNHHNSKISIQLFKKFGKQWIGNVCMCERNKE